MPAISDTALIQRIQQQYGSAIFDGVQVIRSCYFSKQTYGTGGSTEFNFFGDVVGQNGVTETTTNMKRANSFSQRMFLIKQIRTLFYLPSSAVPISTATIGSTYLSQLHDVAFSSSIFEFRIQDKDYLKIANPLLFMPFGAGIVSAVLNVPLSSATTFQNYGTISPRKDDIFTLDPPQLIESEVTFTMKIKYATAVTIPVAGVIGIWLDGLEFRPIQ